MKKKVIYLDNNSTTPVDPAVRDAMDPYFCHEFGNYSSSVHPYGWVAQRAVEQARAKVAKLIGADTSEIIFTSGATESNNLAILGLLKNFQAQGKHLITCKTEHSCLLAVANYFEELGGEVTYLPVDCFGNIDLKDLENAIKENTIVVSLMHGNNELGTLHPISEIGKLCKQKNIYFHTDAAQTFGKVPINVDEMNIDLLSLSAHKIYGPKGIGALFVRNRNKKIYLNPILQGSSQEKGVRPGTLNVPGIVGLGKASEIASEELSKNSILELRNFLKLALLKIFPELKINTDPKNFIPGTLHCTFEGIDQDSLIMCIPDLAVSSISACCTSKRTSHVLEAAGILGNGKTAHVRFSIGRFNTEQDIENTILSVQNAIGKLKKTGPTSKGTEIGVK